MDERDRREKAKDNGNRHSKHRDEKKERRWEGGLQDERAKDGKESFAVQKHTREIDDRQRYDLTTGKQRGERGKDDRKHGDKIREEKQEEMPVPVVADRLGFTKEASRQISGGDKDGRRTNVDRDHRGQPIKQSKDLDRQLEPKGTRDPAEARESKGHVANKGNQTVSKAPRATSSQDKERVLSVSAAKDRTTSDNQPKRTQDSDTVDLAIADRDPARPRGRLEEEVSNPLYEDKALHDKYGQRSKFEPSVSVSSSSCTRRPREQNWHMTDHADQGKQYLGFDEEVRSWEPRVLNQDSDDERRRLVSHERNWDSRPSLSPARGPNAHEHEEFVRGPDSMLSKDGALLKRKRHKFLQGAGPTKARRVDEASVERLEQSHQGTQMNRIPTDGPMVRPLPPNRLLGHSALLPPPPPYRPGVDNPAVMGCPTNFVEGSNPLRESGRYDRKAGGGHLRRSEMVGPGDTWGGFGMGNWNAHNQGPVPGPGNMFPSFPQMGSGGPQMGSGGFLGVGQQFHVSQMYGPSGARPSADIGFGGSRFHMGDGGAGFPGHGPNHGPVMGWHRFPDGSESHHPLSGFMDTWEGPGRYPDERQRFGHRDWDQFSQGMSGGGWEGALEPWQGQPGDAKFDLNPPHSHNEALYEARIGEEVSHPDPHTEKVQVEEDHVPETFEISPAYSIDPMAKTDLKASKRTKERMQMMLLHADVSAKLVSIDLYNEYLSLLPPSEAKKREAIAQDCMDVSTAFIDEDLEFEVDSEAQDLLLNLDPYAMFLPSLSDSAKDALKIYHRPMQQNSVQKSVFGSFLLPESSLMKTMPSPDIEPVKRGGMESFGEQAHIPMGPGAQTEATCFEVAEAKEAVEVHHSKETRVANAVKSFDRHAEGIGFVGNKEQGSAENSVLGDENPSLTWQASESYVQLSKNLENDQKIPVNEISSDHPSDHLEASQVVERKHSEAQLDDDDDQTRPVNEVDYSQPADHLKASQVVERDDSQGELVEDKGVDSEVLASSSRRMEELGRSFEGAEAIEISDPKGKSRPQESPEKAHKNTN